MRRLPRSLALALGVILLLFGAGSAAFVGPDNTLMLGELQEPGEAQGLPVATNPVITSFENLDLVVRAESSGKTFLGVAHRVDVDDLLAGVRHFEITRMSLNAVGGRIEEGRPTKLRPHRIVGWRDSSRGEGVQELVIPLTGEPLGVVAVPRSGKGRVSIAFGAHVDRLFGAQVGVAMIGVLLLLVWWLLGRTGRRERKDRPPRPVTTGRFEPVYFPAGSGTGTSGTGSSGTGSSSTGSSSTGSSGTGSSRSTALRRIAYVLGVGLLATGCGGLPSQTPVPESLPGEEPVSGPSKVALTDAELEEAVADYAKRHRKARKAAGAPRYDATAWLRSEAGPKLETAWVATALAQQAGSRRAVPRFTASGAQVYSPRFRTYPMWAAVVLTDKDTSSLVVFTRTSFDQPWLATTTSRLAPGELPVSVGRAIAPSRHTRDAAEVAAERVRTFWDTGSVKGLVVDRVTRRARKAAAARGPLAVRDWSDPLQQVRIVEVEDGHLVVTVHGIAGVEPHVLMSALLVPGDGKPRLLGSTLARSVD